jgi:hypothetical protein
MFIMQLGEGVDGVLFVRRQVRGFVLAARRRGWGHGMGLGGVSDTCNARPDLADALRGLSTHVHD